MEPDPTAYDKLDRMVYGFFDNNDTLVYIGSSRISLIEVEDNHRNAFTYFPNNKQEDRPFRVMLRDADPNYGTFKPLVEIICTRPTIERIEGQMIRTIKPFYNKHTDPVAASKKNGYY
jgi:hypothetical protein